MTDAVEAWSRYRDERPRYARAAADVRGNLLQVSAAARIPVEVHAREKDLAEFARKTMRKHYSDPWAQVTDKAGVRVIVERGGHVDAMLDAMRSSQWITIKDGSIADKRNQEPTQLDYSGVHLQAFAPALPGDREPLEVEVQLRTRAQDCWAAIVSHKLLYKPAVELPPERRRQLHRLLAFMEAFDDEVDRVGNELPLLPDYESKVLLQIAEKVYLRHYPNMVWDHELSREITGIVAATLADASVDAYVSDVEDFAEEYSPEIRVVLEDYGTDAIEHDPRYLLMAQPEVVLIYERLTKSRESLKAAWRNSDVPFELLDAVADAFGLPVS